MLSPKKSRESAHGKDLISTLPTDVTQKILEKLPLLTATRTSILSTTWKENWLSLKTLDFNADFWKGQMKNESLDGEKFCSIITSIFLSHNGPIKKFLLHIPINIKCNLSPWISFLSKNGVENIEIHNDILIQSPITSNIFHCTHLVKLKLVRVTLGPPPIDFKGFANLLDLCFYLVSFRGNSCQSLISKCPRLTTLVLFGCDGLDHIVVNAPFLHTFSISGALETLTLKDITNVSTVHLLLKEIEEESIKAKLADPLMILASSSRLKNLLLEEDATKALAAGSIRSLPLTFNHLSRLALKDLHLSDVNSFRSTCLAICSCPNINFLKIRVLRIFVEHEYDDYNNKNYDYDDKKTILRHLHTVKIYGIRGTIAELKLLQHLLAISIVLESIYGYHHHKIKVNRKVKMLTELLKFPRASSKAQLFLEQGTGNSW